MIVEYDVFKEHDLFKYNSDRRLNDTNVWRLRH